MADVNNDGRIDILSLDMLPEDLITLKSSGVEDGFSIYNRYLKDGYSPQYMQNTLHLNRGDHVFSEVGFQSGIAATEWSWAVLAADFDLDGWKDLYITNGILGATNDMDYINFISQDHVQRKIGQAETTLDFTKHIPQKKTHNYAFRNNGNVSFTDVTSRWFDLITSFSNGSAYGDLDNDGDLDLVINNVNQPAFIYENLTNNRNQHHFITIRLIGSKKNTFGIGAKIELFSGDLYVYEENFPVKSYLSSVPNEILIGLGDRMVIDSLRITWPDFSMETLYNVHANSAIEIQYKNEASVLKSDHPTRRTYLCNASDLFDFTHQEGSTLDFDRDPLIPFALSNEGPAISIGDINGDSLDDIFIGGAKAQPGVLYVQNKDGIFLKHQTELFKQHAISEDVSHVFFDADNDGDVDLLIVSGGNEFLSGDPLMPRLYFNQSGQFSYVPTAFKDVSVNASVVKIIDIDNDSDKDVLICSNALPGKFGETARNFILINDGAGKFTDATEAFGTDFMYAGLINDLAVKDFDGNGFDDFVVGGDWMPLTLFLNDGKSLEAIRIADSEGWWNTVIVGDFDQDGDSDIVAGNWGLNTRLSASKNKPIELYRSDFDDNGTVETLITYYYKGQRTLLSSKDELHKQMPFIKKKYLLYNEFAKATVEDIFPRDKLKSAMRKEVKMLSTTYFENLGDNTFKPHILPEGAQQSSVNGIFADDFNEDGYLDLLLVGNNYEISTQLGRLDASHGVLLLNNRNGFFEQQSNQGFNVAGPARKIGKITIHDDVYYIVTLNNAKPIFLRKCNESK